MPNDTNRVELIIAALPSNVTEVTPSDGDDPVAGQLIQIPSWTNNDWIVMLGEEGHLIQIPVWLSKMLDYLGLLESEYRTLLMIGKNNTHLNDYTCELAIETQVQKEKLYTVYYSMCCKINSTFNLRVGDRRLAENETEDIVVYEG